MLTRRLWIGRRDVVVAVVVLALAILGTLGWRLARSELFDTPMYHVTVEMTFPESSKLCVVSDDLKGLNLPGIQGHMLCGSYINLDQATPLNQLEDGDDLWVAVKEIHVDYRHFSLISGVSK